MSWSIIFRNRMSYVTISFVISRENHHFTIQNWFKTMIFKNMYLVLQFYHFMLLRGVTQCNKSKQLPLTYSTTYSKWNKLGFLPSFWKMALRMKNVTFVPKMCLKLQAMTFFHIYSFFLPHYPIVYKFLKKYIKKQAQKSVFFIFVKKCNVQQTASLLWTRP